VRDYLGAEAAPHPRSQPGYGSRTRDGQRLLVRVFRPLSYHSLLVWHQLAPRLLTMQLTGTASTFREPTSETRTTRSWSSKRPKRRRLSNPRED
jgi:hypothetical protein